MPQKLETVLKHVEEISNDVNKQYIKDYHRYLIARDTSTIYQKDNIKLIQMFAKFLESKTFKDVKDNETIMAFLDIKRKSKEEDQEQKSIVFKDSTKKISSPSLKKKNVAVIISTTIQMLVD
ncbi:MAG: hypothetical protein ACR2F1_14665 [Nitrososphaeraceae archaeon]